MPAGLALSSGIPRRRTLTWVLALMRQREPPQNLFNPAPNRKAS